MQQKHFMSHPDQTGDPQFRIVNDRKRKSSRIHVLCDVLFRLRSKNLSPVCTGTVSLHSKGFRGAKNKDPGFQRFARTKSFLPPPPPPSFLFFALTPFFVRAKRRKLRSSLFLRSLLHGNACYAGCGTAFPFFDKSNQSDNQFTETKPQNAEQHNAK